MFGCDRAQSRHQNGWGRQKNWVCARRDPAQTGVCFSWILNRPEIVAHRDHGEKDHQQDAKRDQWLAPLGASALLVKQPQEPAEQRETSPCKIEDSLHSPFTILYHAQIESKDEWTAHISFTLREECAMHLSAARGGSRASHGEGPCV